MQSFTSVAALMAVGALAGHGDRSDVHRTFEEICVENGFDFEVHEVTTEDGYILNVFRIPGLIDEVSHSNAVKPPVLM